MIGQLISFRDSLPMPDCNLIIKIRKGLGYGKMGEIGNTYTNENGAFTFRNVSVKDNKEIVFHGDLT